MSSDKGMQDKYNCTQGNRCSLYDSDLEKEFGDFLRERSYQVLQQYNSVAHIVLEDRNFDERSIIYCIGVIDGLLRQKEHMENPAEPQALLELRRFLWWVDWVRDDSERYEGDDW